MNEMFLSHKNVKTNQYQHRGAHRYLHPNRLSLKSCLWWILCTCLRMFLVSKFFTTRGELVLCPSDTLPRRVQSPATPWSATSPSAPESEPHNLSEKTPMRQYGATSS